MEMAKRRGRSRWFCREMSARNRRALAYQRGCRSGWLMRGQNPPGADAASCRWGLRKRLPVFQNLIFRAGQIVGSWTAATACLFWYLQNQQMVET